MHAWLVKAGEVLQGVPDDQGIVVESFSDEMGGRHAMIHSVFGMRINGAWGMALREQVRRRFGLLAEASHVDDGILLSFAPGQVPAVAGAAGHAGRAGGGRHAPGRGAHRLAALRHALPPLRHPRAVHPAHDAWPADAGLPAAAQGRRAAGVRAAASPTSRSWPRRCASASTTRYDVPRLKRLLERLHDGELWTRHVDTPLPSPFVYPLLLAWDWAYLDAGHAEERRSDAVAMRKAWSVAPGPLRPEIVAAVEAELQKTAPERRARDANELAALLDDLGDLTDAEIAERVTADAGRPDRRRLLAERRIVAGRVRRRPTRVDPRHRRHALSPGWRPTPGSSAWRCAWSATARAAHRGVAGASATGCR